jgi:hypothetical protein
VTAGEQPLEGATDVRDDRVNLSRHGTVAALPAPQPNPYGPSRHPMDPGPRLLEPPMTWIGLCIPFVVVALHVLIALRA